MKVFNAASEPLLPELAEALADYRRRRAFDPAGYLAAKAARVHQYMTGAGLDTVVIGLSGGIDSAVAAALVEHTRRVLGGPRLLAAILPARGWDGVTRQDQAAELAWSVAQHLGVEALEVDIAPVVAALTAAVGTAAVRRGAGPLGPGTAWSRGQVTATTRTPALYYLTSLLTEQGRPALVGGTTNLDEGGYLGYVGKASDGMVDLQLISDLHKSEVRAVAAALGLPAGVCAAVPDGDMFDGRPDEQVFGAPYDMVELLRWAKVADPAPWAARVAGWSAPARDQFARLSARLEKLHAYNAHKYAVGSPAVHLDVLPAHVPGGWTHTPEA